MIKTAVFERIVRNTYGVGPHPTGFVIDGYKVNGEWVNEHEFYLAMANFYKDRHPVTLELLDTE